MRSIKVITSAMLAILLTAYVNARFGTGLFVELIYICGSESAIPMLYSTIIISIIPFLVAAALLNVYLRINGRRIQRLKNLLNKRMQH